MQLGECMCVSGRQPTVEQWLSLREGAGFRATWAVWLAMLPREGELLVPATLSDAELAVLGGGALVRHLHLHPFS